MRGIRNGIIVNHKFMVDRVYVVKIQLDKPSTRRI